VTAAHAPARPAVWSVSMVRNEADIVEAFVRHNLRYVDGMAIIDHGSVDGTLAILAALAREGLPLVLVESRAAGYLQGPMTTAMARRVFAQQGADFALPLDADEFVKVASRDAFRQALAAIPPGRHGLLHWLTYVPAFDRARDGIVAMLAGATRRAGEKQAFNKAVIGRHLLDDPAAVLGNGNHYVAAFDGQPLVEAPAHARIHARHAAIAHVPIRSADQLVAKVAIKRLARLAAARPWQPDAASQATYDAVVAGTRLTDDDLVLHALNWSLPRWAWNEPGAIERVDDPFLAPIELRYTPPGPADPLPLALDAVERMVRRIAELRHAPPGPERAP
jgi:hypothetical protein